MIYPIISKPESPPSHRRRRCGPGAGAARTHRRRTRLCSTAAQCDPLPNAPPSSRLPCALLRRPALPGPVDRGHHPAAGGPCEAAQGGDPRAKELQGKDTHAMELMHFWNATCLQCAQCDVCYKLGGNVGVQERGGEHRGHWAEAGERADRCRTQSAWLCTSFPSQPFLFIYSLFLTLLTRCGRVLLSHCADQGGTRHGAIAGDGGCAGGWRHGAAARQTRDGGYANKTGPNSEGGVGGRQPRVAAHSHRCQPC